MLPCPMIIQVPRYEEIQISRIQGDPIALAKSHPTSHPASAPLRSPFSPPPSPSANAESEHGNRRESVKIPISV